MEEQIRKVPPPPPPRRPDTPPTQARPWAEETPTNVNEIKVSEVEQPEPQTQDESSGKKRLNPKLVTGLLIGGAVICFALMIVFAIQLFS